MEMMAGNYLYSNESSVITAMMSIIEEAMEMTGVVVFNYALISNIVEHIKDLQLTIINPKEILVESKNLIMDEPEIKTNF